MKSEMIGLTGNQGSGKDTVADCLVKHYGYTKIAFSDGIYELVEKKLKVPSWVMKDRLWKGNAWNLLNPFVKSCLPWKYRLEVFLRLKGKSPRVWLQTIGEEARKENPNVWIHMLEEKCRKLRSNNHHRIVVTDIRHRNEYLALKNQGALIARIARKSVDQLAEANPDPHISEQWVREAKHIPSIFVVSNSGNEGAALPAQTLFMEVQRLRRVSKKRN